MWYLLIHGGTISSGFLALVLGRGSYWMPGWIRSFWKITLPGVIGDVLAHLEGRGVGHADAQLAFAVHILQQVVQPLDRGSGRAT